MRVFIGGDDPRTVNWRIWNRGNVADSFEISFNHYADVSASAVGLESEARRLYPPVNLTT